MEDSVIQQIVKALLKSVVVFIKHFINRLKNDIIFVPAVNSTD